MAPFPFSWLSNMPLCINATSSASSRPPPHTRAAPVSWPWHVMLQGTGVLCPVRLCSEPGGSECGGQCADAKVIRPVWTERCRWRGRRRRAGHGLVLVGGPGRHPGLLRRSRACSCHQQESRDPQQAFRLWLRRKHEEQLRERQTEELRKQEEFLFFLQGAAGRDRAFKQ